MKWLSDPVLLFRVLLYIAAGATIVQLMSVALALWCVVHRSCFVV